MNTHLTYLLLDLFTILGPLILSFDKKVAFYTKWKYFFPGMLITAVFFLVWDEIFTRKGVWQFNPEFVTGVFLGSLPLEEYLFFMVVPFSCIFIYECILCYFPFPAEDKRFNQVLVLLGGILVIAAMFFHDKAYTFWNFLFAGAFLLLTFVIFRNNFPFNSKAFMISFGISLIPFLIVNGFLTALPVLIYNNAENLGIRIYTIPFEDVFYGMLLMVMNIAFYEWRRRDTLSKGLK
ncbi:MAG: lycopene cyclase domain-containing protein [Bacteroidia bacterium]|nr:lycopene cyclase domain-containing protein [Bacteroidia bacterium]